MNTDKTEEYDENEGEDVPVEGEEDHVEDEAHVREDN